MKRSARAQLLDLLVGRVYRSQAVDKLHSALRFDNPHWYPVCDIHLARAAELERQAFELERGRRPREVAA